MHVCALQVTIAPASSLIGQPLSMAKFTQTFKAKIVAFKSGAPTATAAPSPISDTVPSAGDILVLNQEPDFDEKNPEFGASFVEVHRIKDGMPKPFISSFVVTVRVCRGSDGQGFRFRGSGLAGGIRSWLWIAMRAQSAPARSEGMLAKGQR